GTEVPLRRGRLGVPRLGRERGEPFTVTGQCDEGVEDGTDLFLACHVVINDRLPLDADRIKHEHQCRAGTVLTCSAVQQSRARVRGGQCSKYSQNGVGRVGQVTEVVRDEWVTFAHDWHRRSLLDRRRNQQWGRYSLMWDDGQ